MAPRAMSAAIIVTRPGAIPVLLPVSRSALRGSMRRWEPRLCGCCSRSVSKRPSKRSRNASTSLAKKQRQIELALEQARYEATRARRQYDTVDPDNRLVAGELERRWNAALAAVRALEEELEALLRQRPATLSAEERKRLLQMGWRLLGTIRRPLPSRVSVSSGSCCVRW